MLRGDVKRTEARGSRVARRHNLLRAMEGEDISIEEEGSMSEGPVWQSGDQLQRHETEGKVGRHQGAVEEATEHLATDSRFEATGNAADCGSFDISSDVEAITKAIRKIQKQAKSQDKDRFQEAVALVSGSLQDQFAVLEKRLEENTEKKVQAVATSLKRKISQMQNQLEDQARRIRAAQRLIEDGDKHYEEDRQRLQEELTDIQEENRDVRSVLRVVLKEQVRTKTFFKALREEVAGMLKTSVHHQETASMVAETLDKGFASVSGTRSQAKAGVGNKIPKDSLGAVHLTVDSDLSNDRKKLAASDPRVESRNTCGTLENDLGNKRQMQEHGASGPVPVHFEGPHLKRALKENVSSKRNSRFVRVHWDVEGKEPGKSEGIKEGRPVNEETSMRMSDELLGKEAEVNISKVQFPSQEDGQEKLPTRRSKVEMATQTLEEGDLEELPVKQKVQTSDSQALRDATSAEGQSENLRIERANVRQKVLPAVVNGSGIKLRGCITTVPIDRPDAHRIRIQNVGKARVMRVCK